MPRLFIILCATLLFFTQTRVITQAWADDSVKIQLHSVMAPLIENSRALGNTSVTPFLEARTQDDASAICKHHQLVKEAIFNVFYNHPVKKEGNSIIFGSHGKRIKKAVNKALKQDLVTDVHLYAGTQSMAQGVSGKLPYANIGCRPIIKLPERF